MDFTLEQCMHLKRQEKGFSITRDRVKCYLFCHFINPVDVVSQGKLIRTSANACMLWTPGSPVFYKAEIIYLFHNFIHFQVDDPEAFARIGVPLNRLFYTEMQDRITRTVEQLEFFLGLGEQERKPQLSEMLSDLFTGLTEEQKNQRITIGRSTHYAFDNLRSMIYISPAEWSVEKMAEYVYLSRSYFSIRYKEYYGVSPNEDLIQASLLLAVRLLTTTRIQVTDVAYECGFRSLEYFIRLFKSKYGVTPGKYRELNLIEEENG
ncbi:MAG: helix-turn-helix transcriptional regulator [Clostridia bacterium]|nr:helix-turn-helix transcriptional regulator [Clostridia bacterium]